MSLVDFRRPFPESMFTDDSYVQKLKMALTNSCSKGHFSCVYDMIEDSNCNQEPNFCRLFYSISENEGYIQEENTTRLYIYSEIVRYFRDLVSIYKKSGRKDFYPNLFDCKQGDNIGSLYINGRQVYRDRYTRNKDVMHPIYVNIGFAINESVGVELDDEDLHLGYLEIFVLNKGRDSCIIHDARVYKLLRDSIYIGESEGFKYV